MTCITIFRVFFKLKVLTDDQASDHIRQFNGFAEMKIAAERLARKYYINKHPERELNNKDNKELL